MDRPVDRAVDRPVDRAVDRAGADPLVGRVLDGRYEVGSRIARGGMAGVYRATDLRLERTVAVKVMHAGLGDDDDFAARFVGEARAAARLAHPNVVSVFDQGEDDGVVFLAMEHVPGRTLRDVIRGEAPLPPGRALALLEPVLSALAAAHASGMIHRDVKPENVLISEQGQVKVADFGLARAVSTESGTGAQHSSTQGVLIGSVSYLSPELVVDGLADPRADVYAAGVLLYEMLTGTKPHAGDSPIQVAYKHVHEDVPAPSAAVGGVPAYLDALVARATARDRAARPADAGVLLHQVHRVRQALTEGLDDDPELTEDLVPLAAAAGALGSAGAGGAPPATPAPSATGPSGGVEHTSVVPTGAGTPPGPEPGPAPGSPGRPGPPGDPATRRRGRGPRLLALVLVLAVLAGLGVWYLGFVRYTATPGVVDLSVRKATSRVESEGLHLEVGSRAYSENVAAGAVISTDPEAGTRILDDGTVTAVVSRGPERYDVPALKGRSAQQATAVLSRGNLSLGDTVKRFNEQAPQGTVLATHPQPGSSLRPGTAVDLVVSKGPRPIDVPDLTGRRAGFAERRLTGLGFEVDTTRRHDADVAKGEVVSQDPASGTLFHGDTVSLVVSEGPEMVEVPSVRGSGVEEATRTLEEAGFEVRTEHSGVYVGLKYVVGTDPSPGELAPKGSVVTLSLV